MMNPLFLDPMTLPSRDEMIERCVRAVADVSRKDRRRYKRHPMFQPITIKYDGALGKLVSAFTRDISQSGVSLVHNAPLQTSTHATLQLSHPQIQITVETKWCRPCGAGWYLSYGQFVGLSAAKISRLVLATAAEKCCQRLAQRYPFFCPVSLTLCSNHEQVPWVFSRDISTSGMGLFHSIPLCNHHVLLEFSSDDDTRLAFAADIDWCTPCDNGWYLSGASFARLTLEKLECR